MEWTVATLQTLYRYTLDLIRKLINRETKGILSMCSVTRIRGVTKDLTIEKRLNIEKSLILNDARDCCDPSTHTYIFT